MTKKNLKFIHLDFNEREMDKLRNIVIFAELQWIYKNNRRR